MGVFERQRDGIGRCVERLQVTLIRGDSGGAAEALPTLQLRARQHGHHFENDTLERVIAPANRKSHRQYNPVCK